jgi:hypothetical protein
VTAVRAALLPHPPVLVPELAGRAADELDPLREACRLAVDGVLSASSALVVIGDGPVWGIAARSAVGSFHPYGADVEVRLPEDRLWADLSTLPEPRRLDVLPLSLAVAAWLLDRFADTSSGRPRLRLAGEGPEPVPEHVATPTGSKVPPLVACTVPATLGPGAATAVGRALVEVAANHGPVGVLAVGDLSARRSAAAPGAYHPAAAEFDARIADALVRGDLDALAGLDPADAAELLVGGRAVLQALAGAMRDGSRPTGEVLYDEAPYGVGYLVALLSSPDEPAAPGARAR